MAKEKSEVIIRMQMYRLRQQGHLLAIIDDGQTDGYKHFGWQSPNPVGRDTRSIAAFVREVVEQYCEALSPVAK